ncbi:hypothetical protein HF1_05260 [Mycoplasma haemofelis str. Langford 1]|uniref:Uncharacterized protein n=1 Tax=Mycoplasma haemofelis (strain Langford 1) TaxID=941640 RepID=E8ZHB3_MYCHL|nr:hypothetical protein [Mycoplasma haemofelis]CBY92534.1 hypothetical protein HF1_05260 [Mycoplasma haemofelis str. Langford 1]
MVGFGISKLLLGSTSLGIGAFGLGVSFLLPDASKEEMSITTKKTSLSDREVSEIEDIIESNEKVEEVTTHKAEELSVLDAIKTEEEPKPVIPQCSIYEVEKPTGSGSNRKVHRIIQKIKDDKERFLTLPWQTYTFKKEIRNACPKAMQKSVDVYVWREKGYWTYTKDIQKDWLADSEVQKASDL